MIYKIIHTAGIDLIGSNGITTSPDRVVVAELLRGYAERAVTDGRWKLIHREGDPQRTELYDLREDPGERTNLAAAHPEQVSRFLELLAVFAQRNSPVSATPGQVEISPEELEALRALGYVGTE